MRNPKNILVTGGYGFIGSNLIRYIFKDSNYSGRVVNCDSMTYAANRRNLKEIEEKYSHSGRYVFLEKDICNFGSMSSLFEDYSIDMVINVAAETHVDRSISGPAPFIQSNIVGTFNLLESARLAWRDRQDVLFHQISTDEVFGSLGSTGYFNESTPYDPRSPYSASKASSDHIVRAYFNTYGLPVTLSNSSNNYGPRQYPEKLIPLMITHMQKGLPLPVYGDGKNIRDWLFVEDHCEAIWKIVTFAASGAIYTIGGDNEIENIELIRRLCSVVAEKFDVPLKSLLDKITFVEDRAGHDRRYAIDCSRIKKELKWLPKTSFSDGLSKTVEWYLSESNHGVCN